MKILRSLLSEYLSEPTQHAMQIEGRWGCGKTYCYREILEPYIRDIEVTGTNKKCRLLLPLLLLLKWRHRKVANKKYMPVYISLFGLKSVEDIKTKIMMNFLQLKYFKASCSKSPSTRKALKITQSILSIGLKVFFNFKKIGNFKEYVADIKTIGENVLGTKELVICFDDLERKDSALKIRNLAGYINSLIDEGVKVLIISNENLMEKIIGTRVKFVPNVEETLQSIIKEKYSRHPLYLKYLNENIDDLVKLSEATDHNFRHIIYALGILRNCYLKIRTEIIDRKNEISEKLQAELKPISNLILALAVEYKLDSLEYDDFKEYAKYFLSANAADNSSNNANLLSSQKEKEETKVGYFLEKYHNILKKPYHIYPSIFNYVTAHDEFNTESFIGEFKEKFKLDQGKVPPQYEALNSLSYQNCLSLPDKEYHDKTTLVIKYAEDGQFVLPSDYLTVMYYAERFNNVFGLNLVEVKDKLIKGLKKCVQRQSSPSAHINFSQFRGTVGDGEISDINKQLYEAGIAEIERFEEQAIKDKVQKSIDELLINNTLEFENHYIANNKFLAVFSHYAFLNYINLEEFIDKIKAANGTILFSLIYFFKEKYKNSEKIKGELENLKKFTSLLSEYQEKLSQVDGNKLRSYILKEFIEALTKLIEKQESRQ